MADARRMITQHKSLPEQTDSANGPAASRPFQNVFDLGTIGLKVVLMVMPTPMKKAALFQSVPITCIDYEAQARTRSNNQSSCQPEACTSLPTIQLQ